VALAIKKVRRFIYGLQHENNLERLVNKKGDDKVDIQVFLWRDSCTAKIPAAIMVTPMMS
jgi:hypothetical protein